MFEIIEKVNYLLVFTALILNVYVVKSFGKGVLNVLFVSFGFCIFFFGASELFAFFKHSGVYDLAESTGHIWWHVLVNLSFISLIWGGYRIKYIVDHESMEGFSNKDIYMYAFLSVIAVGVFILTPILESVLSTSPVSIFIDSFGMHHLTVFILGSIGGWYLYKVKGQWGLLGTSILSMIVFIILIGGQHFWEAIAETFKIIKLEDEIIEGVELIFVLPALVAVVFSQFRLFKYVRGVNKLK